MGEKIGISGASIISMNWALSDNQQLKAQGLGNLQIPTFSGFGVWISLSVAFPAFAQNWTVVWEQGKISEKDLGA